MPEFMAERLFEPLGMVDTGFEVPAAQRHRFTNYNRTGPTNSLAGGRSQWSVEHPAHLPFGQQGDDWHRRRLAHVRSHAQQAVPGGPGLRIRWVGRHRGDRSLTRAGSRVRFMVGFRAGSGRLRQ
ncbi:beta-lactamase family protein [Streptomyces sp. SID12488]|nr:beta-lactamase family protein [Streptomyces sp. SID12488]